MNYLTGAILLTSTLVTMFWLLILTELYLIRKALEKIARRS